MTNQETLQRMIKYRNMMLYEFEENRRFIESEPEYFKTIIQLGQEIRAFQEYYDVRLPEGNEAPQTKGPGQSPLGRIEQ